jgi:hypothetical protein
LVKLEKLSSSRTTNGEETRTFISSRLKARSHERFARTASAFNTTPLRNSFGVLETMADVMLMRGVPEHIRSDNGADMTAKVVGNWLTQVRVRLYQ